MGKLGEKRAFKKIADGSVGWYCEWCGEEVFPGKEEDPEVDPKKILQAARDHNLSCEKNPLVTKD
jgi:hypothetical protein